MFLEILSKYYQFCLIFNTSVCTYTELVYPIPTYYVPTYFIRIYAEFLSSVYFKKTINYGLCFRIFTYVGIYVLPAYLLEIADLFLMLMTNDIDKGNMYDLYLLHNVYKTAIFNKIFKQT